MPQANVKATDAILAVKAALANFSKQTADGLAEIDAEVRRTLEWLEHDRPAYWNERVRRAYDKVGEAKDDLRRCLTFQSSDSHRPSCTEQRAALAKAQQHLRYCQEKRERVRHWAREVASEIHEYQGRVAGLATAADHDAPAAMALLERVLVAVEQYATGGGAGASKTEISESGGTNEGQSSE